MARPVHKAISGNYTVTWNALDLGMTEEGWHMETTRKGEIVRFEEFGDADIDLINRGATITVEAVLKEWAETSLQTILWPWSATFGQETCWGNMAMGALTGANILAKPLVLTAKTCTDPGAGVGDYTFHRAMIHPDFASRVNFNSKVRLMPVKFLIFLDDVGESSAIDYRYFTLS